MFSIIWNWLFPNYEIREIVDRYLNFHELDADVSFNDKTAIIILKNGIFNEPEIKSELVILTKHLEGNIMVTSVDVLNQETL